MSETVRVDEPIVMVVAASSARRLLLHGPDAGAGLEIQRRESVE